VCIIIYNLGQKLVETAQLPDQTLYSPSTFYPPPRSMLFFKRENDLQGTQHCIGEGRESKLAQLQQFIALNIL